MDTIEGRGAAPSLVLALAGRLPDDSLTTALASGGREHFGWGRDRHLAADIFDAINANTRLTGDYKKPPKIPSYPRPGDKAEKKKPTSLAELHKQFGAGKH